MKNSPLLLLPPHLPRWQQLHPHTRTLRYLKMPPRGEKWQEAVSREKVVMGEVGSQVEVCDQVFR